MPGSVGAGAGDREYALFLQPWLTRTEWAAYDFPLHAMLRRGFAFGGDLSILADPLVAMIKVALERQSERNESA